MTDSCKRWPKYLLEQATASPPEGCEGLIVPDSTPVVSFGNPVRATVATIGLNPSSREFSKDRGLAMLESLEISDYKDLKCYHGDKILNGCTNYFKVNPLNDFFQPLDCIIREGACASYYAGARPDARHLALACHLDLSPWATSSSWSKLEKHNQKKKKLQKLQDAGISPLREHITCGHYSLVIANGIGATGGIGTISGNKAKGNTKSANIVEWNEVKNIEREINNPNRSQSPITLYRAKFGNTLFLAWSCFLKYNLKYIPKLTQFVTEEYNNFLNERRKT